MNILAIDPGASGGLAWTIEGEVITAECMPDTMTDIIDWIRSFRAMNPVDTMAFVERVGGYKHGNSGPAACKFARHCGHLESTLYAFGFPAEYVLPNTWMRALGTFSKDKKERKNQIKEMMARKYPFLKVTLATSDALGILTYAMNLNRSTNLKTNRS